MYFLAKVIAQWLYSTREHLLSGITYPGECVQGYRRCPGLASRRLFSNSSRQRIDNSTKLAEVFLTAVGAQAHASDNGLVHEIDLVLLRQPRVNLNDRTLDPPDWARTRHADKLGARSVRIPLREDLHWVNADSSEMLDLDRVLNELEAFDARKTVSF
jgi:hypothetical protein